MPQATLLTYLLPPPPQSLPRPLIDSSHSASRASHTSTFPTSPSKHTGSERNNAILDNIDPDTFLKAPDSSIDTCKNPLFPVQSYVLPVGATINEVEGGHVEALRRLTSIVLPVRYPDSFFKGAVHEAVPKAFSRVVLFESRPIGWIRCRLDPMSGPLRLGHPDRTYPQKQIYIQALCLLAPYRGQGLATALLDSISTLELLRQYNVSSAYAHVWEDNEDALEWYRKRGFKQILKVDEYYRKLKPPGAWIVKKDFS